jgi:CheY-like chemotaxis protein
MSTVLNILLAEDNPDDVFLFEQALRKASVDIVLRTVCDGLEALAYLKGEGLYSDRTAYPIPQIMLLDLNMPRMNGFEVFERVRLDPTWGRLIVHVLSASARQTDVQHAYDLRANSYVIKPNQIMDLVAFIATLWQWHRFAVLPEPCSWPP